MLKAVAVGDNCIDNYLEPINKSFVGGNALNVAVALKTNNIHTAYVGPVGNDKNGERIIEELKNKEVDVSRIKKLPMKSAVTDVFLDNAEREFIEEHMKIIEEFIIDEDTMDFIKKHDLIHNSINGSTIKYLEKFNSFNNIITFDYSDKFDNNLLEETLPLVDIAFLSCSEYNLEEIDELIYKWIGLGPELFIITLGETGSIAYDKKGEKWFQKAYEVSNVVDTLGAGDGFIGSFLAEWLKGNNISCALDKASRYARNICMHYGAWL